MPAPLDVSGITNDPCSALTDQQADTFAGTLSDTDVGNSTLAGAAKACNWIFHGERYSLGSFSGGVILPSAKHQGLSSLYKAHQRGTVDTLRSVGPIAGYPAVIHTIGRTIGDGYCRLSVGVRNDTIYQIDTGLSPDHPAEQDSCRVAKKLAKFVVTNLKESR